MSIEKKEDYSIPFDRLDEEEEILYFLLFCYWINKTIGGKKKVFFSLSLSRALPSFLVVLQHYANCFDLNITIYIIYKTIELHHKCYPTYSLN